MYKLSRRNKDKDKNHDYGRTAVPVLRKNYDYGEVWPKVLDEYRDGKVKSLREFMDKLRRKPSPIKRASDYQLYKRASRADNVLDQIGMLIANKNIAPAFSAVERNLQTLVNYLNNFALHSDIPNLSKATVVLDNGQTETKKLSFELNQESIKNWMRQNYPIIQIGNIQHPYEGAWLVHDTNDVVRATFNYRLPGSGAGHSMAQHIRGELGFIKRQWTHMAKRSKDIEEQAIPFLSELSMSIEEIIDSMNHKDAYKLAVALGRLVTQLKNTPKGATDDAVFDVSLNDEQERQFEDSNKLRNADPEEEYNKAYVSALDDGIHAFSRKIVESNKPHEPNVYDGVDEPFWGKQSTVEYWKQLEKGVNSPAVQDMINYIRQMAPLMGDNS